MLLAQRNSTYIQCTFKSSIRNLNVLKKNYICLIYFIMNDAYYMSRLRKKRYGATDNNLTQVNFRQDTRVNEIYIHVFALMCSDHIA